MAENLTRQILSEHLVDGELTPGEPISLRVDQTLLQDATGTMACMQFEQLGVPRVKVDRAVQYIDHNVIQLDFKNPDDHRVFQALARKHGIHYSRPLASPSRASTGATSSRRAVALTFADAADYDRAEVGQTWTLPNVRRELEDGADEIAVRIEESGEELRLTHDFAAKEREILLHGGLLHYLKEHSASA